MTKEFIKLTLKEYINLKEKLQLGNTMPETSHIVIISTAYISDKLQYELIGNFQGNMETLSCNDTLLEKFLIEKTEQAMFNCLTKISNLQYLNNTEVEENNISDLWNNREDAIRKLKDKLHELNMIIHNIELSNNGWAVIAA